MATERNRKKGASFLEFALAGIPALFAFISIFEIGLGMWNYHTLARSVNQAARLASLRGADCSSNGNSCGLTVGTLTTLIGSRAIGIPQSKLMVTLVTDSGQTTTCNPVSSCTSSSTSWPPSTNNDNQVGKKVTVSAKYQFNSALCMLWPGAGKVNFSSVWLPASSTQKILF